MKLKAKHRDLRYESSALRHRLRQADLSCKSNLNYFYSLFRQLPTGIGQEGSNDLTEGEWRRKVAGNPETQIFGFLAKNRLLGGELSGG